MQALCSKYRPWEWCESLILFLIGIMLNNLASAEFQVNNKEAQ